LRRVPYEVHIVKGFGERAAIFRAFEREAVRFPNHRLLKLGEFVVISKKFSYNLILTSSWKPIL
jgi:hypothetical protein